MRSTNPMSERLVSIRRKRSSAGSSRRRDRRPRRSAWYFPSTEGSSLMRLYSKRAVATRSRLSSLCTRSSNALEDAPREIRPGMHVSDRNVGHVLPRLIRNAGDDLEDLELRQVAPAPVEEVHREEQRVREGAVAHALFLTMDLLYGRRRHLSKFKVLEVIARVPYQAWEHVAYIAITHMHPRPDFARRVFERV